MPRSGDRGGAGPSDELARRQRAVRQVLVVEDEPVTRRAIADYLQHAGYTVLQESNGLDALVRMRRSLPDVVVLDLSLPVMSGARFVEAVRNERHLASVAIVLLSGGAELPAAAEALGVRAALAKPVDLDVLLAVVDRLSQS